MLGRRYVRITKKFREFAATRDVGLVEQSALEYACPILRVDGTQELHETLKRITQQYIVTNKAQIQQIF